MVHIHHKLPTCANCGYVFREDQPDNFCPSCGQHNQEVSLSLGHVLEEFLEGIFHSDSKVFRTAKLLLLRPGELTRRFLEERRMPCVPPIRLYIFIGFVFFFLLSLSIKPRSDQPARKLMQTGNRQAVADSLRAAGDNAPQFRMESSSSSLTAALGLNFNQAELALLSKNPSPARLDSAIRSPRQEPTVLRKTALRQAVRALNTSSDELTHK